MTGRRGPRFLLAIAIAGLIAFGGRAAAGDPGYKTSVGRYVAPDVVAHLPWTAHELMYGVGAIEILAGLIVATGTACPPS